LSASVCATRYHSLHTDPNESAVDMIEAYKRECSNMRIKPISKLLEQLAVSTTDHCYSFSSHLLNACFVIQRLDQLSTPIDTLDLKNVRLESRSCEALEAVLSRMHMTTIDLERTGLEDDVSTVVIDFVIHFCTCVCSYTLHTALVWSCTV